MKKLFGLFVILMSMALLFTFASCGSTGAAVDDDDDAPLVRETGDGQSSGSGALNDNVSMPDFAAVLAGNASNEIVYGRQSAAARAQIIESAKADGYDVSFGDDGSMTVTGGDGAVFVQKSDGSWIMQRENGQSAQIGGEWPDNRFTKLLPKPDFKMSGSNLSEDEFSAAFSPVTVDQVKAYANKVKAGGFTVDPEETDQNYYGVVVYTYSASNADGYRVEVTFASGTCGISVSK